MYEMEGPRLAAQRFSEPIARLPRAAGSPPVLATRWNLPVYRPFLASPGSPPSRCPSLAVKQFYCDSTGPHKGFRTPSP